MAFAVGAALCVILAPQGQQADPGDSDCGRRCDDHCRRMIWPTRWGVAVLGPLPQGLPAFPVPWITDVDFVPSSDWRLGGRLWFRLPTRASFLACMRRGSARSRSQPGNGRTWRGQSRGRIFSGLSVSSSSSRTPVAEAAGAKTQLTGVVGALVVALAAGAGARPSTHLSVPRWPQS